MHANTCEMDPNDHRLYCNLMSKLREAPHLSSVGEVLAIPDVPGVVTLGRRHALCKVEPGSVLLPRLGERGVDLIPHSFEIRKGTTQFTFSGKKTKTKRQNCKDLAT